jgi:hypothetical protein
MDLGHLTLKRGAPTNEDGVELVSSQEAKVIL